MQDVNGMSLDELREAYIDLRQEPLDGTTLEPPRVSHYDTWDQWVTEMERPHAYVDNLFAQGLSYVYGVGIRLLCDIISEPLEFYLGPARPEHAITLTFRAGGMHYSATRGITTVTTSTTQLRKRANEFSMEVQEDKKKKAKKGKQFKADKGQKEAKKNKGTTKAQQRAAEKFNKRKKQSEKDKKIWAKQSEDSSEDSTQASRDNGTTETARMSSRDTRTGKRGSSEIEGAKEEDVATKRRRNRIDSFLNFTVNADVNEESDVPEDGPEFFDNG